MHKKYCRRREKISYFLDYAILYFNKLPRIHGAALILDDNLERIFTCVIRPRLSWHAGGTAQIQV